MTKKSLVLVFAFVNLLAQTAFAEECFKGAIFDLTQKLETAGKEKNMTDGPKYLLTFVDGSPSQDPAKRQFEKACWFALKDPIPEFYSPGNVACKVSKCGPRRQLLIYATLEVTFEESGNCPFTSMTCENNLLKLMFTPISEESAKYQVHNYFSIHPAVATDPNAGTAFLTSDNVQKSFEGRGTRSAGSPPGPTKFIVPAK